jgi:branched-chain amino acid transport system substrate-binding protein
MFASDTGSLDPKYPLNTMYGKVLKMLGATRLAVYAIGISPNSTRANTTVSQSFARVGGKTPVLDDSVAYGGVDFTAAALIAKQKNVNALWPNLTGASNIALAQAYKDAGIKLKAAAFPVGYDPALINSPAWSTVQGDIFESVFHPFGVPDAGTKTMQAALEKYDHFSKTQFATFSQNEGWLGADLMIRGLQGAGTNPTHASVIKSLRSIKSYDGNGLLANPVNYSTIFGHDPKELCIWLERAEKNGFVLVQNQPVCGTDIPGTSSTGSS